MIDESLVEFAEWDKPVVTLDYRNPEGSDMQVKTWRDLQGRRMVALQSFEPSTRTRTTVAIYPEDLEGVFQAMREAAAQPMPEEPTQ
jgi:hypothetical protein